MKLCRKVWWNYPKAFYRYGIFYPVLIRPGPLHSRTGPGNSATSCTASPWTTEIHYMSELQKWEWMYNNWHLVYTTRTKRSIWPTTNEDIITLYDTFIHLSTRNISYCYCYYLYYKNRTVSVWSLNMHAVG